MKSNLTEKWMDIEHDQHYIKTCLHAVWGAKRMGKLFHTPKRILRKKVVK